MLIVNGPCSIATRLHLRVFSHRNKRAKPMVCLRKRSTFMVGFPTEFSRENAGLEKRLTMVQCEAPKIAKLVQITPITMVYGIYNYSYWGL